MRCAKPSTIAVFTHAWLTDQHRIVLGASLQDFEWCANLIIAPDHRIELALGRRSVRSMLYFQVPDDSPQRLQSPPWRRHALRRWPFPG